MAIKIYKNGAEVRLGSGNVAICASRFEGEAADRVLDFYPHKPHTVGEKLSETELEEIRSRGGYAPVRIVFDSMAGIEVLIEKLEEIRDGMIATEESR